MIWLRRRLTARVPPCPQEYGLTRQEKLSIGHGICTPLLKKIQADLRRNVDEGAEENVNRLNPM